MNQIPNNLLILSILGLFALCSANAQIRLYKAVSANGGAYESSATPNGAVIRSTLGQVAIEKRKNSDTTEHILYNGYWRKMQPVDSLSWGDVPNDPLSEFKRIKNYPNPFSGKTNIVYELPGSARVVLVVYDVNGNEIAKLFDGVQDQGQHNVEFSAMSKSGIEYSSGSYLYELKVEPVSYVGSSAFSSYSVRNVMVLVK